MYRDGAFRRQKSGEILARLSDVDFIKFGLKDVKSRWRKLGADRNTITPYLDNYSVQTTLQALTRPFYSLLMQSYASSPFNRRLQAILLPPKRVFSMVD